MSANNVGKVRSHRQGKPMKHLTAILLSSALMIYPVKALDDQGKAMVTAAAYLFVPTYCPGWKADPVRFREILGILGVTEAQLGTKPLSDGVASALQGFSIGNIPNSCSLIIQQAGPFGTRLFQPR